MLAGLFGAREETVGATVPRQDEPPTPARKAVFPRLGVGGGHANP
jgi:hypothetical protein